MKELLFEITKKNIYKNKFKKTYSILANKKQGIVAYKGR